MMSIQAIKNKKKGVVFTANSLAHGKMNVLVSHAFYVEILEKNSLLPVKDDIWKIMGDLCKWKRIVIIERDIILGCILVAFLHPAKIECVTNYGLSQREKYANDF